MPGDRLNELVEELRRFSRDREWGRFHDPKNLSMLVASEAGELLQLFRWVPNADADAFAAAPEHRARIGEEVADVAIGLLLLADRVGLDLPAAIRAKIRRNGEKYPARRRRRRGAAPTAVL